MNMNDIRPVHANVTMIFGFIPGYRLQISIPELLILIIKIMSLGHNGDDEITVVLSRQVLDSAMHTRDPKAQQTT